MKKELLVIPEPGLSISEERVTEIWQQALEIVPKEKRLDILEEWRSRSRALEQYLRSRGLQGPMLGTQRLIEARVGQLLGPAVEGRPSKTTVMTGVSQVKEDHREDFRILANALNGTHLDENEWCKSRRALVSFLRQKLGLLPEVPPLPAGIFRCIVADPPWQQDTGPDTWGGKIEKGHDALSYEQMSIEQIKNKADEIKKHIADDAHLYLWTINKYVETAYAVARAWGFKPSVLLVWAKSPHGVGLGDAYRITTEFILYARRGSLKELKIMETTWFNWPRKKHSAKPEEFYQMAESMTPAPYGKKDRLDMFARKERPGWTPWGDEIGTL